MAWEREPEGLSDPQEQRRILADLRRRRRVWLDRAAACRQAWEALVRAEELASDLNPDDPLRESLDLVGAALEYLLVELETTARIADEEIANWGRQRRFVPDEGAGR